MYKRFIKFIKLITDELLNRGYDFEDAIVKLDNPNINLYRVNEELDILERSRMIGQDDADAVRSVLIYLFIKNTDLELEEVYTLVFGNGKKIVWH